MKAIALVALSMLAVIAQAQTTAPAPSPTQAQTCDMSMSMAMLHKGAVRLENSVKYLGLTPEQAKDLATRSQSVLNEASKGQNKRGDYSFKFDGSNTCGITVAAIGPIDGLTHKDAAQVMRQAFKVADSTTKKSEDYHTKHGKGPWGK